MNETKVSKWKILLGGAFLLISIFMLQSNTINAASAHTCTVVFISSDGTSVPTQIVNQGAYFTAFPTPTREGYTFAGWYTDEKLTYKVSSNYYINVSNQDTVLVFYAKWTKIKVYSIVATYSSTTAYVETTLDRSNIKVIAMYSNGTSGTVTDFTISKLSVSSLGTNVYTVTYDGCVSNFYVVGIARQYVSVTFIPNGGSNVDSIAGILSGDTIILPKEPTRSGYTFVGWYQDSSLTLPLTSKTKIAYNMYAYAKWKKDTVEDETVDYKLDQTIIKLHLYGEDNIIVGSYNGDEENYITYKSSNSSIVKVDDTGRVLGVDYGKVTIYVIAPDGSLLKCKVSVLPVHPITKIKTNVKGKRLRVGKKFIIKTTIEPSNASVKKLKYVSSKKSVATVSSTGKVTAKKAGTCYITVKTTDGTNLKKNVKIIVK
ncbi:MAG: InlB B-repeat-containing protein [Velocimicrobium sp.]